MNKFVIVDGLPYLYFNGKAYAVRWDEKGFTVGAEVELTSVPSVTYSELSIKAKCAGHLDSIGEQVPEAPEAPEGQNENPEGTADDEANAAPENTENPEGQNNAENAQQAPENPEAPEKDIEEMTLPELKEYAKARNVALNGARTKDAIIEAIKAAEVAE